MLGVLPAQGMAAPVRAHIGVAQFLAGVRVVALPGKQVVLGGGTGEMMVRITPPAPAASSGLAYDLTKNEWAEFDAIAKPGWAVPGFETIRGIPSLGLRLPAEDNSGAAPVAPAASATARVELARTTVPSDEDPDVLQNAVEATLYAGVEVAKQGWAATAAVRDPLQFYVTSLEETLAATLTIRSGAALGATGRSSDTRSVARIAAGTSSALGNDLLDISLMVVGGEASPDVLVNAWLSGVADSSLADYIDSSFTYDDLSATFLLEHDLQFDFSLGPSAFGPREFGFSIETLSQVPEPSTAALVLAALLFAVGSRNRTPPAHVG